MNTTVAEVKLWGRTIGAVALDEASDVASFEYADPFINSGIEVSPFKMPLREGVFRFAGLSRGTFRGLPGLLADSLPDRFGNALIHAWLATQGRTPDSFNAIERLCYTGARGIGALEFEPALGPTPRTSQRVEVDALVELATEVLTARNTFRAHLGDEDRKEALRDILRVGTSAGGARAKAIIAYHPETGEVRSGQVPAPDGFGYWLLKFDGVSGNRDKELEDPQGYCAIEYAYHLMARAAGMQMTECRLLEEGGRRHFMTRRFDRDEQGRKLHMQSLGALQHYDFNQAGAHSYEQALLTIRQLNLPMSALEEQFRRAVFNIVARNQDDHVKNIAFLMDKAGQWSLSPAYDVTYSYNPDGAWTSRHQMSLNGKRDGFTMADLEACANTAGLKRGKAKAIYEQVREAVAQWPDFAKRAGITPAVADRIVATHRTLPAK